jgi:hypothetical protein
VLRRHLLYRALGLKPRARRRVSDVPLARLDSRASHCTDDGVPPYLICMAWLDAGHDCSTTWGDVCANDHPAGAEYNSYPVSASGCSQCAPGGGEAPALCSAETYAGLTSADEACQLWLDAGYTCDTAYNEVCSNDVGRACSGLNPQPAGSGLTTRSCPPPPRASIRVNQHPGGEDFNAAPLVWLFHCTQCPDLDVCDVQNTYAWGPPTEAVCDLWISQGFSCTSTWQDACAADVCRARARTLGPAGLCVASLLLLCCC